MENNGFIFVNLLPYREKQKALQIKKFAGLMITFGLAGLLLAGIGHTTLTIKTEHQSSRNRFIESENKTLEETIKSISELKENIKITLAKRKIVESLQTNRADGVNIINELANNLPDDTYLQSIKKVGDKLTIIGQTTSNNKVSHYMTALDQSPIFSTATLVEIKSVVLVNNQSGSRDKKMKQKSEEISMNEFIITVEMEKSQEELKRIAAEKAEAEKQEAEKAAKAKKAKTKKSPANS